MNEVSTNRVVSVNPNDIFAQFGLGTPDTSQNVTQRVGTIQVESPAVDAEFEEIEPIALTGAIEEFEEVIEDYLEEPSEEELLEQATQVLTTNEEGQAVFVERAAQEELNQQMQSDIDALAELKKKMEESNLIPLNPKSFEVDESTSRFSGASWFNAIQESTVVLAGLGGIGSYILFLLSRMKPKQIFIYDDDTVELANLSGQLYSKSMIGEKKVNAMSMLAKDFSDYHGVMSIAERFTEHTAASDIMICGFDNMQARYTFFHSWRVHVIDKPVEERGKCLFIDGRLAAEEFQVFCITGDNDYYIDKYKTEYLFSDSKADATQCSYKQTSYCANMIGSVIVNLFTNFIANSLKPIIPRDLPFKTYYDASFMFFKTEV